MLPSTKMPEIIDSKSVKNLVKAHALAGAVVLGRPGGFAILVKYGGNERAISAQRSGRMRIWRNLNTAAAFIRDELGIPRFEIDIADHEPDTVTRKRPDTAERQRRMHSAVEHDTWFREQVEKTLDKIDSGAAELVSNEDHMRKWQHKRAELLARATGKR